MSVLFVYWKDALHTVILISDTALKCTQSCFLNFLWRKERWGGDQPVSFPMLQKKLPIQQHKSED